jgi:hypothetical protein
MSQSSILIDAPSSACYKEKEREKKKETARGLFSQGGTHLAGSY